MRNPRTVWSGDFLLYKENHALDAWFSRAYGDEQNAIYRQETGWLNGVKSEEGKPPLCKGRWQPNRLTEGLLGKVGIRKYFCD